MDFPAGLLSSACCASVRHLRQILRKLARAGRRERYPAHLLAEANDDLAFDDVHVKDHRMR